MWAEMLSLFTNTTWILCVILPLALGFILCIIEGIVPGFGIFGILGMICEVGGVIAHAIIVSTVPIGGILLDSTTAVLSVFLLIICLAVIFGLMFLLFVKSAKSGALAKTAFFDKHTALPNDYDKQFENEFAELFQKEGIVIAECRPVGKLRIGQQVYDVIAKGKVIEKGEIAKVVKIEGTNIYVDKLTY